MPAVFDSVEKIQKAFDGAPFLDTNPRRKKAIEYYFQKRGVLQLETTSPTNWPRLVYPTPEKLEKQIQEFTLRHQEQTSKKWQWQMAHLRELSYDTFAHAKKVTDPLFWKHVSKKVMDREYRDDSKTIDLKSSLISDEKYRPMIAAFVDNPEYRKQLTETVKHSPVYQNHKGLAQHAKERRKLKKEVSASQIKRSHHIVSEHREQLFALKELLNWSKEGKEQSRPVRKQEEKK
ncbi:MAG: hypothetical protein V1776_04320 [Candidatus Diapherotrites archaeon]